MSWFTRLRNALRPHQLEEELEEEMRDHLERRAGALERSGVERGEAERRAKLRFGNVARLREESRDARLTRFVDGTIQDARYALRLMRKQPGFTATIVISLGLAIGANTAVFSILDAALLKPLPVAEPERLITISTPGITEPGADPEPERTTFSYPQLRGFRAAAGDSARLALFTHAGSAEVQGLDADAPIEQAVVQLVSGDAFEILGVTPALGRLFTLDDDRTPGGHPVVVLSYEYWQQRFRGESTVTGRLINVRGDRSEIIGVARQGFFGVEPGQIVQVWQPAMQYGNKQAFENPGWTWFQIVGRLGRGATPELVAARLQPVLRDHNAAMVKRFPTMPQATRQQFLEAKIYARPAPNGLSRFRKSYAGPLWVIFGVALAILAIACSNVASLLLARAASRASEVAMRVSLGAGRLRLIRQLLTESLMYASAGALGWMLAKSIAPVMVAALSSNVETLDLVLPMNTTALLFSIGVALAAAVLFGSAPAWQASRSQPIQVMRGATGQAGKLRLGRFFVSVQVAFAFGLVIMGAAFLFSLRNLTRVDTGFRAQGLTAYTIQTGGEKISDETGSQLTQLLRNRVGALPGVTGTAAAGWAIFTGASWTEQVIVQGKAPGEHEEILYSVTDGYFKTLGTAMLAGRDFDRGDSGKLDETPAIVNLAFASKYFAGLDPIGQHFKYPSAKQPCVIVGVVANTHFGDLRKSSEPIAYFPHQRMLGWLYVRSTGGPVPVRVLDREARMVRAGLRMGKAFPLESLVNDTILRERLLAVVGGTLGGLGLVLAAIGLFGLLNYSVERRTKEIGIRAALGARFEQIVGLVLRETVALVGFGLVAGLVAAVLVLRSLTKLLFGIGPTDPVVAITGAAVFLVAALIAAGLPARRAAGVDPMCALRVE